MKHIVLAANPEAEQPWVSDAAAQIASEVGAEVDVVSFDGLEMEALSTLPREEYRKRAQAAADAAAQRLRAAGVPVTTAVLPGLAREGIARFADEVNADLIVIGSSTRPRIAQRLLGSVPIALIQHSSRPVLVVTQPGKHE